MENEYYVVSKKEMLSFLKLAKSLSDNIESLILNKNNNLGDKITTFKFDDDFLYPSQSTEDF